MSIVRNKKVWALIVACGAGTVFQIGSNGCADYMTTQALTSFDFCSVFNCTGGSFFNLCSPVRLLADCPQTTVETQ